MKKHLLFMLTVFLSLGFFSSVDICAQHALVVTGADAKTGFGSVSVSIGQPFISTDSARRGIISHGVQQPFEIQRLPVSVQDNTSKVHASAFPNPTFDFLKITIDGTISERHSIRISDLKGNELLVQEFSGSDFLLPMDHYAAGLYIVDINDADTVISSFRIVKQ